MQGGEPDIDSVAKIVLNDFQRGRLPYFTTPNVWHQIRVFMGLAAVHKCISFSRHVQPSYYCYKCMCLLTRFYISVLLIACRICLLPDKVAWKLAYSTHTVQWEILRCPIFTLNSLWNSTCKVDLHIYILACLCMSTKITKLHRMPICENWALRKFPHLAPVKGLHRRWLTDSSDIHIKKPQRC